MASASRDSLDVLFCTPTMALSGGIKVVLAISSRLAARGHAVELFSYAGPPRWHDISVPMLKSRRLEDIVPFRYDFVVATNAFLVPLLLPIAGERLIFYAQDYETFHYSLDGTFAGFMAESATLRDIYRLPVPIITQSISVQRLIRERAGRSSIYAPLGIRKDVFRPGERKLPGGPIRILFVGNYLMPHKGISDGLEAMKLLSRDHEVELVLATQEDRNRALLAELPYQVEIHFRPSEDAMAQIYNSANIYCCSSWYEGLGLPALEAFCCGVPVVSTRTQGVDDYGIDNVNLLLANVHDPIDLANKLATIIDDQVLAARLVAAGYETVRTRYDWEAGIDAFEQALGECRAARRATVGVEPRYLEALLSQLEAEGGLTPVAVLQRHGELARQVDDVCALVCIDGAEIHIRRLRELRDELAPYLDNSRAQYYRAFRALFDLCQLIIGLEGRNDFVPLVRRILSARKDLASHPSASLTEIRYLD